MKIALFDLTSSSETKLTGATTFSREKNPWHEAVTLHRSKTRTTVQRNVPSLAPSPPSEVALHRCSNSKGYADE